MNEVPAGLFDRLFDDAAVFPPGNLPVDVAVPAHDGHRAAPYAALVGPFILAARDLDELALRLAGREPGSFPLSLTVPVSGLADALEYLAAVPAVDLVGVEVALDENDDPRDLVAALGDVRDDRTVHVEVPRDARRAAVIDVLAAQGHRAKLRTGGVRADLHPGEAELAAAVHALVAAQVPFKATAGLHHAVRTTAPDTGFEQHGFLNLMLATAAARDGADVATLTEVLAERDTAHVRDGVPGLDPGVRRSFRSFGTCSVTEPIAELVALGLLPTELLPADLLPQEAR